MNRRAFTLIEMLVVIAIIAILAALLLPSLSSANSRGKQVACINDLKQLTVAAQIYTADNDGRLVENPPGGADPNSWAPGNMRLANNATNLTLIKQGKLYPYVSNPGVYHCPADLSHSSGLLHTRSYSMNSWMGSREMETYPYTAYTGGYRTFVRDNELAAAGLQSTDGFLLFARI